MQRFLIMNLARSKGTKNTLNSLTPTRKRRGRTKNTEPVSLQGNILGSPPLLIDGFSLQGRRPYQEDRVKMIIDLAGSCPGSIDSVRALQSSIGQWSRLSMFCVCDGHAGARAAEFVIANLSTTFWNVCVQVLQRKEKQKEANSDVPSDEEEDAVVVETKFAEMKMREDDNRDELIKDMLKATLLTLDKNWLERVKNSRVNDGCCVVVTLLIDDRWYFAHLGDCRAILVRGNVAKDITKDHTPGVDKNETLRIQKAGGRLEKRPGGVQRVCAGGTKIAVTRAIGDANMKRLRNEADTPVLSSEADTKVVSSETFGDDFTLVLVSDGVTSRMSNKNIANCLRLACQEEHRSNLSQYLVERAYQRGSFDNISALIIRPNKKK